MECSSVSTDCVAGEYQEPSRHARKASAAETWRARWVVGEDGAEEVTRGQCGQSLEGHVRNLVPF